VLGTIVERNLGESLAIFQLFSQIWVKSGVKFHFCKISPSFSGNLGQKWGKNLHTGQPETSPGPFIL
jgi:hypothetical protein